MATLSELKWLAVDFDSLASRGITHSGGKSFMATCAVCGEQRKLFLKDVKRTQSNYCSRACANKGLIKHPMKNCKICGDEFHAVKGFSKYTTCGKPTCRTEVKSGSRNPNWKGGKTPTRRALMSRKEYKQWRTAVFERDDYTCTFCGVRGGEMNADHILPWAYYPDHRYIVGNGRTLCLECHKTTYKELRAHAEKVSNPEKSMIAVDFDNTLCVSGPPDYSIGEPIHENIDKLRECVDLGYKIIIHTARHWEEYHLIEAWLNQHDVPFKSIVCGKLLAHRYIDDKAIPADADWKEYL